MPRHSNKDLTAERKELAAALELEKGETLADALARKIKEAVESAVRGVKAAQPDPLPEDGGTPQGPLAERPIPPEPKPNYLPSAGDELPRMMSNLGDMTPGYPEAYLRKYGADQTRKHYGDRVIYLSRETQSAMGVPIV